MELYEKKNPDFVFFDSEHTINDPKALIKTISNEQVETYKQKFGKK